MVEPGEGRDAEIPSHVWPKRGGLAIWSDFSEQRHVIARVSPNSPLRVLGDQQRFFRVAIPPNDVQGYVLRDAVGPSREEAARLAKMELDEASTNVDSEAWIPVDETQPYASFGRRAAGYVIDTAIAVAVGYVGGILLLAALLPATYTQSERDTASLQASLAMGIILVAYQWIANAYGGTAGKWIVGIRLVADDTGMAPGLRRSGIRYLMSIVSNLAFGLGYYAAAWNSENKTWHDRGAGTAVVPRNRARRRSTA
jgi:uncharacterized RDD family membrane protein YckC